MENRLEVFFRVKSVENIIISVTDEIGNKIKDFKISMLLAEMEKITLTKKQVESANGKNNYFYG